MPVTVQALSIIMGMRLSSCEARSIATVAEAVRHAVILCHGC